jgi:hypothetical protein
LTDKELGVLFYFVLSETLVLFLLQSEEFHCDTPLHAYKEL